MSSTSGGFCVNEAALIVEVVARDTKRPAIPSNMIAEAGRHSGFVVLVTAIFGEHQIRMVYNV